MLQIHQRIKKERLKAGLSEEQVAKAIGIERTTYQYWEKKTPNIDKVKTVAKALGLPENYFLVSDDENLGLPETQIKTDEYKKADKEDRITPKSNPMKELLLQLASLAVICIVKGEIYIYRFKKKHSPLNKKP